MIVGVSMFRLIAAVRKAVALCLAILLTCHAALEGQCACSEALTNCTKSPCACHAELNGHHHTSGSTSCSVTCCAASSESSPSPSQPCSCQSHRAPISAILPPSDAAADSTDLVQFTVTHSHRASAKPVPRSLGQLRFTRANDTWSPLDICVLFCRFLA